MKKISIFIYFLLALFIYGCSDTVSPIEVRPGVETIQTGNFELGTADFKNVDTVIIVALVDSVDIEAIKLNKGNCTVKNFKSKNIKYGQEVSYITNCSNLLHAHIDTSMGSWEFQW